MELGHFSIGLKRLRTGYVYSAEFEKRMEDGRTPIGAANNEIGPSEYWTPSTLLSPDLIIEQMLLSTDVSMLSPKICNNSLNVHSAKDAVPSDLARRRPCL